LIYRVDAGPFFGSDAGNGRIAPDTMLESILSQGLPLNVFIEGHLSLHGFIILAC
jgi:hypothetical protein